jgi:creatinine amidohydrolase
MTTGFERDAVRFASLRADQLRQAARDDALIILPVASTEQHGRHLPVMVDTLLATEIAERAALRLAGDGPVLVAPCVWHGLAEHHMSFGGTFTLDFPSFLGVLRCLCGSLVRHGFRRIALLNGHGGNEAGLRVVVDELARDFDEPIVTLTYWRAAAESFSAILEDQENVRHACEAETSMVLALRPDLVRTDRLADAVGPARPSAPEVAGATLHRWHAFDERTETGVIGNAARASAARGARLLAAAAPAAAAQLRHPAVWSPRERLPGAAFLVE